MGLINLWVLFGYIDANHQLLYKILVIPVAVPTALAFLALAIGLLAAEGPGNVVIRPLTGSNARAVLRRSFLPLIAGVVLVSGLLRRFADVSLEKGPYREIPYLAWCVYPECTLFADRHNADAESKAVCDRPRTQTTILTQDSQRTSSIRKESSMLVLSRKTDESIQIGDDIEIKVLEVRGNRVRLGISAPSDVAIHRSEVTLRLAEEVPARIAGEPDQRGKTAVASLLRIAK